MRKKYLPLELDFQTLYAEDIMMGSFTPETGNGDSGGFDPNDSEQG